MRAIPSPQESAIHTIEARSNFQQYLVESAYVTRTFADVLKGESHRRSYGEQRLADLKNLAREYEHISGKEKQSGDYGQPGEKSPS
jgi:hypothetical protein